MRFSVHAKLFDSDSALYLDDLIAKLQLCALRWAYAQRLLKVVQAVAPQNDSPHSTISSAIPKQFYDLQYSYLDIDEALRIWAEGSHTGTSDNSYRNEAIAPMSSVTNVGITMDAVAAMQASVADGLTQVL